MSLTLRLGTPDDAIRCGTIFYEAFKAFADQHNFPPDIPSPEVGQRAFASRLGQPNIYVVVAELDGRVVGSNVLDERSTIVGLGPITVDPIAQNHGVGRQLMNHALNRIAEQKCPGVRLVQATYHSRSLSLYASLGFEVRGLLACMKGQPLGLEIPGFTVRPAHDDDLEACNRLCRQVHGHDRSGEVRDAIKQGTATVVEHRAQLVGYATLVGFGGHGVGQTTDAIKALLGAASRFVGPGILVPTCNGELFRWCLAHGLRTIQPMTLMSLGLYNEPSGAYIPSILY